jgi:hypothetical protein
MDLVGSVRGAMLGRSSNDISGSGRSAVEVTRIFRDLAGYTTRVHELKRRRSSPVWCAIEGGRLRYP